MGRDPGAQCRSRAAGKGCLWWSESGVRPESAGAISERYTSGGLNLLASRPVDGRHRPAGSPKRHRGSGGIDATRYAVPVHLSGLLGRQLLSPTGEGVGKVDDVIVRLRGDDYPVVTGLVAKVGGRRVFVHISGSPS